ncbi:GerAB/ArcD/ProY family transporter [Sporolactobacillus kofuensis]|uniref:GerAB/ArcD/ProY family transporter n=1 Tax=Sporolactobacillus kofuensis TaxID=269672 RepID=A0ABW1WAT0_9BACL|nr:GerAB/ArcD/ProY family transporter [Sporolactobacillus kofuensis]MCO7175888.1 spore germination protein [Sporolactobacillus kofuensis]
MKKINETHTVGPLAAFFIPQAMQIGVGFLSFASVVTKASGQDAWIAVLISGLSTLLVMWFILRLLENERKYGTPDLFSVHYRIFGKRIGAILNFLSFLYVIGFSVAYLRSIIEILQVEIFNQLSTLSFSILFCLIVWYIVIGGIRNILGVCLLSFIYLVPVFSTAIFVVPHAHFSNLLPIFDHGLQDILSSSFVSTFAYLGFEFLLFVYPFIKSPKDAKKWAYFGLLTTMYTYLMIVLLSILFFGQGELQNTIWPALTFWKSVRFPFLEHIDIICVIILLWNLVPVISLCSWVLARGIKFTFPNVKMKYSLIGILILTIVLTVLIQNGEQVKQVGALINNSGFIFIYLYIPLLLFCQWLKKILSGESA